MSDSDPFFDSEREDGTGKADSPYLKGAYDRSDSATRVGHKNQSLTPSTSGNFSAKSSDSVMSEKRAVKSFRNNDSPTHTPSPSRSPSPYRDQYARSPAYSDSFNSEDSDQDSRRPSPQVTRKSKKKPQGRVGGGYSGTSSNRFNSGTSQDSRYTFKSQGGSSNSANRTKKAFQKNPVKKPAAGNTNTKRSNSITSSQLSPRNTNDVTRRMLSAKGHTISRLRNEFNQLQKDHDEVVRENKLLKALQRRQERALARLDSEESDLPQLLKKHSAELDSMRRRIRKYQERDRDKDRRMKDKDEQFLRNEDDLKNLQALAEDKGLLERHELQKRLHRLQNKLEERKMRVGELEHHVEHIKNNQRHKLQERQAKEEEVKERMAHLEQDNQRLQTMLREKEKELEVMNIYSNRLIKPPGKLRHNLSPTTLRPVMLSKATSTTTDQPKGPVPCPPPADTQRERSAEEQRRREETAARVRSPKDTIPKGNKTDGVASNTNEDEEQGGVPHGDPLKLQPSKQEEKQGFSEHERILQDLDMGWGKREGGRQEDEQLRKEEKRRREKEQRQREREEEDRRRREEEDRRRREEEDRRRREEERQKIQEEEMARRKRQEEDERKETKQKQGIQKARNFDNTDDKDDDENVPFFGSKPAETVKSTKSPSYAVNSVRDLHKYSRGDNHVVQPDIGGGQRHSNNAEQQQEAEGVADERQKKDYLLVRMQEIDEGRKPDSGKNRKTYNFTQPVENLHNGIPSHPDDITKGNKDDTVTFGSYAPTFNSGKPQQQPKPKRTSFFDDDDRSSNEVLPKPSAEQNQNSNLMADLFGSSVAEEKATKSSFSDDKNMFTSSTKAKPVAYPWEKKVEVELGTVNGIKGATNHINSGMSRDSLDGVDDIEEVIL